MSAAAPKAAIIGVGSIAGSHYAGYEAAGVEVVALCDVNPLALSARGIVNGAVAGLHAGTTGVGPLLPWLLLGFALRTKTFFEEHLLRLLNGHPLRVKTDR